MQTSRRTDQVAGDVESGLVIERRFTSPNTPVHGQFEWVTNDIQIKNFDQTIEREIKGVEFPVGFSGVPATVAADKYFRRVVPGLNYMVKLDEKGVPEFLWRSTPDLSMKDKVEDWVGKETSGKQLFHRLAGCWTYWGWKHDYFASVDDARAYYDEMYYLLASQRSAPNSPQWFNTGLHWAYGIEGPAQGHWYINPVTGKDCRSVNSYERPQPHACFIQSVEDKLCGSGSITDLVAREALLFKFGSGTGSNFSNLRAEGEPLSGGGQSSGLLSFLMILDKAAGAIKSGGTTRRAAKMVTLDLDHPDILQYVNWKMKEEEKVSALIAGAASLQKNANAIFAAIADYEGDDESKLDTRVNIELAKSIKRAMNANIAEPHIKRILDLAGQGFTSMKFQQFDTDWQGEGYLSVSGQNSNNSVRIPDQFMEAVESGDDWNLYWRTEKETAKEEGREPVPCETMPASDLWGEISNAAWSCADPGVQFDTTINDWHTCPESGRINGSNPCVTGDTLVATDEGWQRIDSLVGKSARIIGADGQPHFVKDIFPTGRKQVYRLRTKAGLELKLTEDHRLLTKNRGDVAAKDLQVDDELLLEGACFGRTALAEDVAFAIGLALGDGCLTHSIIKEKNHEVVILTMSDEEAEILGEVAATVNSQKALLKPSGSVGRNDPVNVASSPTGSRLSFASKPVVELFQRFAVLDEGSTGKRMTTEALDLDRNATSALLRGLFTADGTVGNSGDKSQYVALDSTSLEMLQQVQMLLLSFGIKGKLYRNRRGGKNRAMLPDGRGGMKEYDVQEMHSLRITRSSRIIFEREIGFHPGSAKADSLAELNASVGVYKDTMTDFLVELEPLGEEKVFDLTEKVTNHFVANGIVVHNCSEYMFLDDTACNLASINLLHCFDKERGVFQVDDYVHSIRLWTIALEISVLMAQFPSKSISRLSYETRTLGLGYCNLGSVLMHMGIPYADVRGFAICGALTAIMTGESYKTSAELSSILGPFKQYEKNKKHMLRVMRNHRRAAYDAPEEEYEGLAVAPKGIDSKKCPKDLLEAARSAWDQAVMQGEEHGYRNAQTTVIAPTGTIGLVMGADTTGVEPLFSIIQYKKLAGGGSLIIPANGLRSGLVNLGYKKVEVDDIIHYVTGTGSFSHCPSITMGSLKELGFTEEQFARMDSEMEKTLDIRGLFSPGILGEEFCRDVLDMSDEQIAEPFFDILDKLGFSAAEIQVANEHMFGHSMIEGAPHLKDEHLPVFDCAQPCGAKGVRSIPWEAHVDMMASAQPFISGAISKTINMTADVSIQDVQDAYMRSWKTGNKACALYRDGSKLSQPLMSSLISPTLIVEDEEVDEEVEMMAVMAEQVVERLPMPAPQAQAVAKAVVQNYVASRQSLPDTRNSNTMKARVGGHTVYLTSSTYDDGKLGEIMITTSKEGAAWRSMLNQFAIAVSIGLQYGIPLEAFVKSFTFQKFEPSGMVQGGSNRVKMSTSIVDYIFRELAIKYLGRDDLAQVSEEDLVTTSISRPEPTPDGLIRHEGDKRDIQLTLDVEPESVDKKRMRLARERGFTGDICGNCGGSQMVRNGTCLKCNECGSTTGCS